MHHHTKCMSYTMHSAIPTRTCHTHVHVPLSIVSFIVARKRFMSVSVCVAGVCVPPARVFSPRGACSIITGPVAMHSAIFVRLRAVRMVPVGPRRRDDSGDGCQHGVVGQHNVTHTLRIRQQLWRALRVRLGTPSTPSTAPAGI
mmetsp:Transcript_7421/g.22950  ORF Transcript_7421/g.22950 Transcript_7421/m.22950 type:complete len:144 (-) Transcript_7421:71-502(-)